MLNKMQRSKTKITRGDNNISKTHFSLLKYFWHSAFKGTLPFSPVSQWIGSTDSLNRSDSQIRLRQHTHTHTHTHTHIKTQVLWSGEARTAAHS